MKQYEQLQLEIILFIAEDVVRTSNDDNQTPMPDFPENWGE